jgi:hypothetical protein
VCEVRKCIECRFFFPIRSKYNKDGVCIFDCIDWEQTQYLEDGNVCLDNKWGFSYCLSGECNQCDYFEEKIND